MNSSPPDSRVAMQLKQAISCQRQGNLSQAQFLFQQVLAVDPYNFSALEGMGLVLGHAGRYEEALNCFSRASIVQPNSADIHFKCGTALTALGRYEEALASFDKAIALNPKFAQAHNSRGNMLNNLKRYDEALASYDKAIACKANLSNAHNNRGAILYGIFKRYDEGLVSLNKAIALDPNFAEAYSNRGLLLSSIGQYEAALTNYDRAIRIKPDYADANYNKALAKLLLGDYEEGWRLYEWRWKTGQFQHYFKNFKSDLWLGDQPVAGKTILLHAEQGFGDTIQMVRYVPMLETLGATIILDVQAPLVSLMQTLKANFIQIEKGREFPPFDLHCPLLSLPLAFKTTVATVPAQVPYLSADPHKQAEMGERLGANVKPRVGLVWSGNPSHVNDSNRSIPLSTLKPLLGFDFEFHSLHKEVRPEDQAVLAELAQIHTHESALRDYSDTAALIANLDLVISVDTSVAHLAGALGKEVWILLPYEPDYRWLTTGSSSPWYPTARLFRQERIGDWEKVAEDLAAALKSL